MMSNRFAGYAAQAQRFHATKIVETALDFTESDGDYWLAYCACIVKTGDFSTKQTRIYVTDCGLMQRFMFREDAADAAKALAKDLLENGLTG